MPKADATSIASAFHDEIKLGVEQSVREGRGRPRLVGLIANDDAGAQLYARWTAKACERDGITYELRQVERVSLEESVIAANKDPDVHGIIVYYPVFGGPIDDYLRDVISVEKDVEGLNHRYRYAMYHNIRQLSDYGGRKCILPCTPLACLKILEHCGAYDNSLPVGSQLKGKSILVYNRSEVVGRPLAAMLANDGATVFSIDITGMLVYTKGSVDGTIRVEETSMAQEEALASADVVVAGVPSKSFRIDAGKLKPGVLAVNFSHHQNFADGAAEQGTFVPAIGKVTIAMLERNLLRRVSLRFPHFSHHTIPIYHRHSPPISRSGCIAVGVGQRYRGTEQLPRRSARRSRLSFLQTGPHLPQQLQQRSASLSACSAGRMWPQCTRVSCTSKPQSSTIGASSPSGISRNEDATWGRATNNCT
jgi:methylenetetrahydrofolate dehydrogenase (NAD+)|tara:strand:+ start:82 stop:1344 length:1263 start_codon:yes stop_codon:yes gene_type:complete